MRPSFSARFTLCCMPRSRCAGSWSTVDRFLTVAYRFSSHEERLAEYLAALDGGVGVGGSGEWERLADDGRDVAGGSLGQRLLCFPLAVGVGELHVLDSVHGDAATVCFGGVDGREPSAGRAVRREPSAGRDRRKRRLADAP